MNHDSAALPPGALVDTLRIDRVLGAGAFGITYLVTDTVLGTPYALKEYLPRDRVRRLPDGRLQALDATAAEFTAGLKHFLAEGRTVARLSHRNIVKVYRCFEANGTAYMLMPWYQGEALHKLLERVGTFSQEEALALAGPLLDALEYLHRQGVVHQDIKPANIYITEDGHPVLLDFGPAGRRRLGSEGYAAIEQSEPMNSAIAGAEHPVQMALAMKLAVEAGRLAYESGRIPKRLYANASSPVEETIRS